MMRDDLNEQFLGMNHAHLFEHYEILGFFHPLCSGRHFIDLHEQFQNCHDYDILIFLCKELLKVAVQFVKVLIES